MHFRMMLMADSGLVEDVTTFVYPPPALQRDRRFPTEGEIYRHCDILADKSNAVEWELWRVECVGSLLVAAGILRDRVWTERDARKRDSWLLPAG